MKLFKKVSALTILFSLVVGLSFSAVQAQTTDTTKTKIPAQTYTLKGKIINAQTAKAVADAKISIKGGDNSAMSNEKGKFKLSGLAPGTYTIKVKAENYQLWKKELSIGNKMKRLMVKLKPAK